MNYRHAFHAGNFADVFKHAVLTLLLEALRRKDAAFCYIDTHAGAGRYDLGAEAARRSAESGSGIVRLWPVADEAPHELLPYLDAVRAANDAPGVLRCYPGSPLVAQARLRPQDRMVLCEQVPDEAARVARTFAGDRRVRVLVDDGYVALKGLVPPRERRGLVLIDPPYERTHEQELAVAALGEAYRRWPGGIYALWYPIKDRATRMRLHRLLRDAGIARILIAELAVFPEDTALRLNGCGLAIVNAPWKLDATLERLSPWLLQRLRAEAGGRTVVEWLVPERRAS